MKTEIREKIENALNGRSSILLTLPTQSEVAVTSYEALGAEHWKVEKRDKEGDVHACFLHFNDEVLNKLSEYDIVDVQVFGKGAVPPDRTQEEGEPSLAEVRGMAHELGRKAQTYFHQLSDYCGCSEAMKLREYADRTNDIGRIAKRALKLLKDVENTGRSWIAEKRAGEDKGKLTFSGMEMYRSFFGGIA